MRRGRPELGHGDVAFAQIFDCIEGAGVRTAGFGLNLKIMAMGIFGKDGIVIVRHTVAEGFAKIGQEGVGGVAAFYDFAGDHRQIGNGVVAAIFFEIFGKGGAPVHSAAFPAVGFELFENRSLQGTCGFQKGLDDLTPVSVEGVGAEVINHHALPGAAGGGYAGIGGGIAEAQKRPLACRHRPG